MSYCPILHVPTFPQSQEGSDGDSLPRHPRRGPTIRCRSVRVAGLASGLARDLIDLFPIPLGFVQAHTWLEIRAQIDHERPKTFFCSNP